MDDMSVRKIFLKNVSQKRIEIQEYFRQQAIRLRQEGKTFLEIVDFWVSIGTQCRTGGTYTSGTEQPELLS